MCQIPILVHTSHYSYHLATLGVENNAYYYGRNEDRTPASKYVRGSYVAGAGAVSLDFTS